MKQAKLKNDALSLALAEIAADARSLRDEVGFLSRVTRQLRNEAIKAHITRTSEFSNYGLTSYPPATS